MGEKPGPNGQVHRDPGPNRPAPTWWGIVGAEFYLELHIKYSMQVKVLKNAQLILNKKIQFPYPYN